MQNDKDGDKKLSREEVPERMAGLFRGSSTRTAMASIDAAEIAEMQKRRPPGGPVRRTWRSRRRGTRRRRQARGPERWRRRIRGGPPGRIDNDEPTILSRTRLILGLGCEVALAPQAPLRARDAGHPDRRHGRHLARGAGRRRQSSGSGTDQGAGRHEYHCEERQAHPGRLERPRLELLSRSD